MYRLSNKSWLSGPQSPERGRDEGCFSRAPGKDTTKVYRYNSGWYRFCKSLARVRPCESGIESLHQYPFGRQLLLSWSYSWPELHETAISRERAVSKGGQEHRRGKLVRTDAARRVDTCRARNSGQRRAVDALGPFRIPLVGVCARAPAAVRRAARRVKAREDEAALAALARDWAHVEADWAGRAGGNSRTRGTRTAFVARRSRAVALLLRLDLVQRAGDGDRTRATVLRLCAAGQGRRVAVVYAGTGRHESAEGSLGGAGADWTHSTSMHRCLVTQQAGTSPRRSSRRRARRKQPCP